MYNLSVVRRVKNGDAGAFRILFEDWAERAYARAYDILGDEEQARQAALLAFADIYGRAKEIADPRGFEAWAEQIVAARACAVAAARRTLTEAQRERLWDGVAAAAGIAVEEGEGSGKKADEPPAGAAAQAPAAREEAAVWQPIYFTPEEEDRPKLEEEPEGAAPAAAPAQDQTEAQEKPPRRVRRRAAAAAAIGVAGVLLLGVGALVGLAASGVIDASFLGEAVGLIG